MNRDGGGKPGSTRAGRQITEEEAALWHQVGRSLDKVKKKPRVTAHSDLAPSRPAQSAAQASPSPAPDATCRRSGRRAKPPAAAPPSAVSPPSRPAAPADIDRRTQRQVAAGKIPIDAVLDLHGLHQGAAHSRLRGFLMSCQANGHRMVLVITGKGAGGSDAEPGDWPTYGRQRGALRRAVPLWLEEPELRGIVIGYAAAGVRHGGEGALYIRLRRARVT